MSHGGMGGGGHGFGHSGGYAHGGHGVHVGHGAGLGAGHGGTVFGHVMHALGFGNHGHHHGAGASHHPDQSPNWNQAMQAEKKNGKFFHIERHPFVMLFLLMTLPLGYLGIIYLIRHNEHPAIVKYSSQQAQPGMQSFQMPPVSSQMAMQPQSVAPAAGYAAAGSAPYSVMEYAGSQNQSARSYAAQYTQAAAGSGIGQMQAMSGTGYGGMLPGNPASVESHPAAFGSPSAGVDTYTVPPRPNDYRMPQLGYLSRQAGAGTGYAMAPPQQNFYAPLNNGRARLVVAR